MIKLLVVDDAPFIREIIRYSLKDHPEIRIVGEAEDGADALLQARMNQPDVILMDLVLPEKNGVEATREILDLFPEMKVVAFSTNDQSQVIVQALDAGAKSFLSKPFTTDELVTAIRQAHHGGKS